MNFFYFTYILTKGFVTRKEIRDLTDDEWIKYKNAFNLFKDKGYLADISKIHLEVDKYAHKNPRFLPWHRMLLLHVESILQMLTKDPKMSIPYWDWTIDASDPGKSKIFTDKYWGISKCYLVSYPTSHCLDRNSSEIDPFYFKRDIERLIKAKGGYDEFRDILELVPHAIVHLNVGGKKGDMSLMWSTNDPIFWHHHSFIDYIWHKKQMYNLKNSYSGYIGNEPVSNEERLYPFNKQIKDVMSLKKCRIKYKPFNINKIMSIGKKPSQLTKEYIDYHGYDIDKVRKYEKYMRGESNKGILRKIFEFITGRYRIA